VLLRASGETTGRDYRLEFVNDGKAAAASGVAHADALVALAEALVGDDDAALDAARQRALEQIGPAALVDAVAVASNFERMVRIADGTGIPLDTPMNLVSEDVREELHLGRFAAATHTPDVAAWQRPLGRVLRKLMPRILKLAGSRMAKARDQSAPRA
jgi:hypothetical protein